MKMNQVTNKVPYGLLSKEEQAQFSVEAKTRDMYEMFDSGEEWTGTAHGGGFCKWFAYRLIIKDDDWYWVDDGDVWAGAVLGESLRPEAIECYDILRPATPAEIQAAKPKVESLEDRVKAEYGDYEVVMLFWDTDDTLCIKVRKPKIQMYHACAQSRKGFYRYVYEHPDGVCDTSTVPALESRKGFTILPIAVLFTKEK